MKRSIKRIVILSTLLSAAGAKAWNAAENQIWLDGSVRGEIAENFTLKITEQVRYKEEGDFYYYHHTDIRPAYSFLKHWTVAPGFRQIAYANTAGVWSEKSMYHLNLGYKASVCGVDLKNRMRLTYTDVDNSDYLADFRPEFTIMLSKGCTGWKLKPFLADEIMYNLNESHFYRNRVNTGVIFSPTASLSMKIFIMHENTEKTKDSDFKENFNYGLYAGYKF
jgi:hypothetical protein